MDMGRIAAAGAVAIALQGPAALAQDEQPTNIPQSVAVLRGLDKTTARVSEMSVQVGRPFRFGALEVVVRACMARPPEEPPEHTAFLDIVEINAAGQKSDVFKGWVFASTPALNAVEHPVYDVWLIRCRGSAQ